MTWLSKLLRRSWWCEVSGHQLGWPKPSEPGIPKIRYECLRCLEEFDSEIALWSLPEPRKTQRADRKRLTLSRLHLRRSA